MTDYNTMTAAQCADWLAERDGWRVSTTDCNGKPIAWIKENVHGYPATGGTTSLTPPRPLTLDAAAAALREPWRLVQVDIWPGNVVARIVRDHCGSRKFVVGPDELTARYRAAVAARMEDDK